MAILFKDRGHLADVLESRLAELHAKVAQVPDATAVGLDRDEWVHELVRRFQVQPPQPVHGEEVEVEALGRRVRDVTNLAGVTFGLNEWGNVQRDTINFQATITFDGDTELLLCAPDGGAAYVPVETISATSVSQGFFYVLESSGSAEFEQELGSWKGQVLAGAARVADHVRSWNERLPDAASAAVDTHLKKISVAAEFTAGLSFAVSGREDAPPRIRTPTITAIRSEVPRAGAVPREQPTLGRYFDEILATLESGLRAIERTPARYRDWKEPELRDTLLIPLNSQYQGGAQAEAFNASGKTDILIRVDDENLFIGECKIWSGAKEFDAAIDQILGYSTWRDSRLALIVFVRNKAMADTMQTAQQVLENRPEFEHWVTGARGRKAHIRWPDDTARTATIALLGCHVGA